MWRATGGVLVMAEPQRWQVSTDAAEVYESCWVGDTVLHVGCGTGVLAREALRRVGSVQEFIRIEVKGSPLAATVGDEVMQSLATASKG